MDTKKWIPPQGVGQPVLLQISDIHLTRAHVPYEITRQRSLWRGSMDTRQRFETLLHTIRSIDVPSTLLITGDLTDLGTPNEWADFEQTLRRLRKGESSLLLMAGNHDVSINTHWAPDTFRTKRTTRENACLEVLKKFDDSHWTPSFDSCDTIEDAFPRQTTIDLDTASVRVFALDSNRYRSGFVNSNAVGEFGRSQLSKFRDLLFAGTGPVIVATHHHITKAHDAPRWGTAAALGLFLIAIDARKLIAVLLDYVAAHASNTVLLIHGHKHQQLFERYGDGEREIFIYGHPSSTMGIDNSVSLDGIIRFAVIGFSSAQGWTIDTKIVPGPAAGGIVQGTRII